MRTAIIVIVTLVVLTFLVSVANCTRSEPTPAPAPVPAATTKDPAAARKLIAAGAVVIDVRTPGEFAEAHLPNATNLPLDTIGEHLTDVDKLVDGDKARAIVLYCAAGSRAAKAKRVLDDAGYLRVVNGGGLDDLR